MPKRVGVIVFFFSIVAAFPIGLAQSPAVEHRLAADRENRPANSSQSLDGEAAFTEWTRSHAIPLGTVEAGHGFDDIEKLGEIVGNAHIVALGEATHGTREFFQLKHRIIEFLATKKGFTIFSIEANMPEAYRLNDYVLHGIGDPRGLIKGMYFWTWNTQEVLAMVEWMRQFNESGKGHIEFTGFDMQYPAMPLDTVRKFVIANDADYLPNLELLLQRVARISEKLAPSLQKTNQDFSQTLRGLTVEQDCRALVEHLEKDRDFYLSQASSDRDIDWVVQNARLVLQYVQLKAGTKSRDESMAENVKWIADHNPRSKIILWAHNGHVTHGAYFGSQPMGKFLAAWFGDQYLNFGFAFNEGSFRAVEPGKGLREFSVLPAPDGSLDRALANTGIPMLAIDLRQLPSIGLVREWIDVPHRTRSVGAVYSEQLSDRYFAVIRVQDAYDVLLFISKTSAAKANTPLK